MRYNLLLLSLILLPTLQAAHVEFETQCYDYDCAAHPEETDSTHQNPEFCTEDKCCESEYCLCFLGTAWIYTCASDIWDNVAKVCKKPWEVEDCEASPPPATTTPTVPTPSNECSERWNPCPTTVDGSDGHTYPEGPCESYYCLCYKDYGVLRDCEPNTFYDERYHACSYPWDVEGLVFSMNPK